MASVAHDDGADSESCARSNRPRRTAMKYFARLDVAIEETAICVIDREWKLLLATMVATAPDAIFKALKKCAPSCGGSATRRDRCRRGCGSSSSSGNIPVVCLEAFHTCGLRSPQCAT